MGRQQIRKVDVTAEKLDIISNLPGDVKHKILIYLPIKAAVRTSVLSSKWRYVWASIPDLVLSDDCVSSSDGTTNRCAKLIKLVDLVLFLHTGPIRKFHLSSKELCHESFDRWMLALSRNGISDVIFKLTSGQKYKVPSNFFSCHALECVHLHNCTVTLPRSFKGFRLLRTLKLENFAVGGNGIENLISSCPLLEYLSLKKFKDFITLKIHAPKLRELYVEGEFLDFQVRTPQLVKASIALERDPINETGSAIRACRNSIIQAFGSLSFIQTLSVRSFFVTHLGYGSLLKELPTTFNHLKEMSVELFLGDQKEAATVMFLLQHAPKLRILDIWSVSGVDNAPVNPAFAIAGVWSKIITIKHVLNHLHSVNIHNFDGTEPELALVESLLGVAPVLENLNLSTEHLVGGQIEPTVLMKLLRFQRASNKAKIFCQ